MDLTQYADEAFWFLQAVVGVIFMVHSLGKLKAPAQTASMYGMPSFVGLLHGLVELVGGVLLVVDMFEQYVGLVFAVIMLGAIFFKVVKWKVPFSAMDKTGWEFDLVLLAASLLIAAS
jgi:uncharacterized membrane protein YphA (DoxX/SURF4 family)